MAAGAIGATWASGSWYDTTWQEDSWGASPDDTGARRAISARRRRRCAILLYRRFRGVK